MTTGKADLTTSAAMLTAASNPVSTGVRPSDDRNSAFMVADTPMNRTAAIDRASFRISDIGQDRLGPRLSTV